MFDNKQLFYGTDNIAETNFFQTNESLFIHKIIVKHKIIFYHCY